MTAKKHPKQLNRVEMEGTLTMCKSGTGKNGSAWAMGFICQYAGGKFPEKFSVKTFSVSGAALFKDGAKVHVTGRLRTESWDDKTTGLKRYGVSIACNTVELLKQMPTDHTPDDPIARREWENDDHEVPF